MRINDLRISVRTLRLITRRRIRKISVVIESEFVLSAGLHIAGMTGKISVAFRRERKRSAAILENDRNLFPGRCPDAKPRSSFR
jgi:hypothetical protein